MRDKWFCCAFKLGFLQLTCKVSLIFRSNLELALSIILKQRELYESKHVSEECRCLKNMRLVIFFDMLLKPSLWKHCIKLHKNLLCNLKKIIVWLKRVVWGILRIWSFVLSRKIINIYDDIARKYGNVTVKDDFRKYKKLEYKKNKLKKDIEFLNNCKQTWCVSKIPYV